MTAAYVLEQGPDGAEARFSHCWQFRYQLHRWLTPGPCAKCECRECADCDCCIEHAAREKRMKSNAWRGVCFVMLNPSTADAFKLDPTIKKCRAFAERWGFDRLDVVNLFAFRSSKPIELYKRAAAAEPIIGLWESAPAHPNGRRSGDGVNVNDAHLVSVCAHASKVIAAWGNHGHDEKLGNRGAFVRELLEAEGIELWHLGLTDSGSPLHPLARGKSFIPLDREPVRWA